MSSCSNLQQFVRTNAGGFEGDSGQWDIPSNPDSSQTGALMHASDVMKAVPEKVTVNGKRYTYHPKGLQAVFVDLKLNDTKT